MVDLYVKLVKAGVKTINEVPLAFRERVKVKINQLEEESTTINE